MNKQKGFTIIELIVVIAQTYCVDSTGLKKQTISTGIGYTCSNDVCP